MYIPYPELPNNSRVWIYQSDKELSIEEIEYICAKAILFIEKWTRHGDDLKGSFTIKYNQFLVLGVDEGFNSVEVFLITFFFHVYAVLSLLRAYKSLYVARYLMLLIVF